MTILFTMLLYVIVAGILLWASGAIGNSFYEYEKVSAIIIREHFIKFNLFYRILFPVVSTFLISNILFYAGYSMYKPWIIVVFYCVIRFLFIIIMGRWFITNKKYIFITSTASIILSIIVTAISQDDKTFFYPSRDNLVSQFWLIICLFVYKVFEKTQLNDRNIYNLKGKLRYYIDKKLHIFLELYKDTVLNVTNDINVIKIIFSIMIVEDYNRPQALRFIERILPAYAKTTGIMQVRSDTILSDSESVHKAATMIQEYYKETLLKYETESCDYFMIREIYIKYNPSDLYADMVREVFIYVDSSDIIKNHIIPRDK